MADADSDPAYHLPFNFIRIRNNAKCNYFSIGIAQVGQTHRLNMEVDLQSLFGLHVHSCTVLIGLDPATPPLPPAFGLIYEGAIGQQR